MSTDDQSCARQEAELTAWAERADFEVRGLLHETASGGKTDREVRNTVLAMARRREIDAVLVTEASRWSRSTADLLSTLEALRSHRVSLKALSGIDMDLGTPHGKLIATVLAGVAEFEKDLIRERTKSGLAAARARGVKLGRQFGQCPSDRHAKRVRDLKAQGASLQVIARHVGLAVNTVRRLLKDKGSAAVEAR